MVTFKLDSKDIEVPRDTIWEASKEQGTLMPHLCRKAETVIVQIECRACMVEIEGERVLAASCVRSVQNGMVVNTASGEQ